MKSKVNSIQLFITFNTASEFQKQTLFKLLKENTPAGVNWKCGLLGYTSANMLVVQLTYADLFASFFWGGVFSQLSTVDIKTAPLPVVNIVGANLNQGYLNTKMLGATFQHAFNLHGGVEVNLKNFLVNMSTKATCEQRNIAQVFVNNNVPPIFQLVGTVYKILEQKLELDIYYK